MLTDKQVFLQRIVYAKLLNDDMLPRMAISVGLIFYGWCTVLGSFDAEAELYEMILAEFEERCVKLLGGESEHIFDNWFDFDLEEKLQILLIDDKCLKCSAFT